MFLATSVIAALDPEASTIYSSQDLVIEQTISGGATIVYSKPGLSIMELNAKYQFYPLNTFRQTLLSADFLPTPLIVGNNLTFTWADTSETNIDFSAKYIVETKNEYQKVGSKIIFPIKSVPKDYQIYLKETELIDQTPEIISQASELASGKDDLFDVSQTVAYWVYKNINYDLSSISLNAQQKASWVFANKRGVCDESTVLFISMMRSLGIPTRFVSGMSYTNSPLFKEKWGLHAWAEVYFPEYGWVPFDLTYGEFGFVDASHIIMKESYDADSTSTDYTWKARNLDKIEVTPKDTSFKAVILNHTGKVEDDFSLVIDPIYFSVKQGSYDLLKIKAKNNKNYYVSSVLNIYAPSEVDLPKAIPIFLKPNEEKYYYVPLKVKELSANYIYTIPLEVVTGFGTMYSTSFDVADDRRYITYQDIQAFIDARQEKINGTLEIECAYNPQIYENESNSIKCLLENKGNTHIVAKVCITLNDGKITCDNNEIALQRNISKDFFTQNSLMGIQNVTVDATFDGNKITKQIQYTVVQRPKLKIELSGPNDTKLYDDLSVNAKLIKLSNTSPTDTVITMVVNGHTSDWDVGVIDQNTDIKIPINTRYLNDGENKISIEVGYDAGKSSGTNININTPPKIQVDFSSSQGNLSSSSDIPETDVQERQTDSADFNIYMEERTLWQKFYIWITDLFDPEQFFR